MKTKSATAIRCNVCQRNLPAGVFRLRKRVNDRGYEYEYREQPCKKCRSAKEVARRKRKRDRKRSERLLAEQRVLNGKRPLPKRSDPPYIPKYMRLLIECNTCGELLPRSEYYREKDYQCKDCHKADKSARWRRMKLEDPEKYERVLRRERKRVQQWKKDNPQKHKIAQRKAKNKRIARLLENGRCDFTDAQWKEILRLYDYTCVVCGKRGGDLEADHIVALANGGEHTASNIMPLCTDCNSLKRDLPLKDFLLEHIQRL